MSSCEIFGLTPLSFSQVVSSGCLFSLVDRCQFPFRVFILGETDLLKWFISPIHKSQKANAGKSVDSRKGNGARGFGTFQEMRRTSRRASLDRSTWGGLCGKSEDIETHFFLGGVPLLCCGSPFGSDLSVF